MTEDARFRMRRARSPAGTSAVGRRRLKVISSLAQDAVFGRKCVAAKREGRFALLLNAFAGEDAGKSRHVPEAVFAKPFDVQQRAARLKQGVNKGDCEIPSCRCCRFEFSPNRRAIGVECC